MVLTWGSVEEAGELIYLHYWQVRGSTMNVGSRPSMMGGGPRMPGMAGMGGMGMSNQGQHQQAEYYTYYDESGKSME